MRYLFRIVTVSIGQKQELKIIETPDSDEAGEEEKTSGSLQRPLSVMKGRRDDVPDFNVLSYLSFSNLADTNIKKPSCFSQTSFNIKELPFTISR